MLNLIVSFGIAFISAILVSITLTRWVRGLALNHGWACQRNGTHHTHKLPIPRFGGVPILVTALGICGIQVILSSNKIVAFGFSLLPLAPILLPAVFLFLTGLIDDIADLRPGTKLLCQVIASALLYWGGVRFAFHYVLYGADFGVPLSFLVTVVWIVGISNAMNLIDGIDGLASGSALFIIVTIIVVALTDHNLHVAFAATVVAGAILGFLRYNFNPASIFLGDCGSLLIGFLLSSLVLFRQEARVSTAIAVAVPLVSFGLPIAETALSILRRFLSRKPIFQADKKHIHHRLLDMGWSQRQAVALLYGFCGVCMVLAISLLSPAPPINIVFIVLGVTIFIGLQTLDYPELQEIGHLARSVVKLRAIIEHNIQIRRAASALSTASTLEDVQLIITGLCEGMDLEGFELTIKPLQSSSPPAHRSKPIQWKRASTSTHKLSPCWRVTVLLGSLGRGEAGSLTLIGSIARRSVLFDVTLVAEQLRTALSAAVMHITASTTTPAPEPVLATRSPEKDKYIFVESPAISKISQRRYSRLLPLLPELRKQPAGSDCGAIRIVNEGERG